MATSYIMRCGWRPAISIGSIGGGIELGALPQRFLLIERQRGEILPAFGFDRAKSLLELGVGDT